VAGTDSDMSKRIANTFAALVKPADFSARAAAEEQGEKDKDQEKGDEEVDEEPSPKGASKAFAPNFTTTSRYSSPPTEPRRPT
jgi:hypothetical protein